MSAKRFLSLPAATKRARPAPEALDRLALHAVGVSVVSVRRASGGVTGPAADHVLAAGDTLVLAGLPEPLALAEEKLLRG